MSQKSSATPPRKTTTPSERVFHGFNEDTHALACPDPAWPRSCGGSETQGDGGRRTEGGDAERWSTGKWIDVDCAHDVGPRPVAGRTLHDVNSVEAGM